MKHSLILNTLQTLTNHKPTQKEIADILGVSINTIGARATRDSDYSLEEIQKLSTAYNTDILSSMGLSWFNKENNCVNVLYRPNVYLSAGYGIEVYDEQAETICLDTKLFITDRGIKINPDNCEIVAISGNSMSPEYRHGDRVILDKSVKNWIDGHIFAFRLNGECFVKEICLLGKRVKAIPLNKEYEPFFIEETDDVEILGRVVPRVRL